MTTPVPAAALTAGTGVVMALTTRNLRGDYLAIVTLGFSEVVRLVASNEIWLTKGTDGISGIPGPWRGRVTPETFNLIYLAIVAVFVVAAFWLLQRVRYSPFGRVLRAIRDDEQIAAVAGKPLVAFKVQAFAVSAGLLGTAGALYGHYLSYVAPHSFTPLITIYAVLALTAGGTGDNRGAVVGAVLVVFFMESTRFATGWLPGLRPGEVAAGRGVFVGGGLVVGLRGGPGGVVPECRPAVYAGARP